MPTLTKAEVVSREEELYIIRVGAKVRSAAHIHCNFPLTLGNLPQGGDQRATVLQKDRSVVSRVRGLAEITAFGATSEGTSPEMRLPVKEADWAPQ